MSVNVEPECGRIDLGGNVGQVPTHVEAIIGRKYALIEDLERCLEQGRAGALQDHRTLLRKVRDEVASAVGEGKLEGGRVGSPSRCAEQPHQTSPAHTPEKSPAR